MYNDRLDPFVIPPDQQAMLRSGSFGKPIPPASVDMAGNTRTPGLDVQVAGVPPLDLSRPLKSVTETDEALIAKALEAAKDVPLVSLPLGGGGVCTVSKNGGPAVEMTLDELSALIESLPNARVSDIQLNGRNIYRVLPSELGREIRFGDFRIIPSPVDMRNFIELPDESPEEPTFKPVELTVQPDERLVLDAELAQAFTGLPPIPFKVRQYCPEWTPEQTETLRRFNAGEIKAGGHVSEYAADDLDSYGITWPKAVLLALVGSLLLTLGGMILMYAVR